LLKETLVCLYVKSNHSLFVLKYFFCLSKVPSATELAIPAANVPAKEDLPVETVHLGECKFDCIFKMCKTVKRDS
jgi:hypothetical protein